MANDALQLIERYLAGELTDAEHAELARWLTERDDHRRLFLAEVDFYRTVRGVLIGEQRELAGEADEETIGVFDKRVLQALHEIQDKAGDLPPVELMPAKKIRPARREQNPAMSPGELASVGAYLLGKALSSRPALLAYAAAAVLLVGALLIPWGGTQAPQAPQTAQTPQAAQQVPPDETPVPPPVRTTVATLTAERDAVWDQKPGGDPRRGDALFPGDRLTLTRGFAEITTARGAVVILEAPSTIELTDNDNAIRLHTGRLVGICEIASSKGFVVRAPHMDITDLGTRFGVDASSNSVTEVHVIEGMVQAVRTMSGTADVQRIRLARGDAVRARANDSTLVRVQHDARRFASINAGNAITLGGTGHGLSVGDHDPNWQVVAIGGEPLDEPALMGVSDRLVSSQSLIKASPGTKYLVLTEAIVPNIPDYINDKRIRYTVRTTLRLPDDFDASRSDLGVKFEADDQLLSIRINGQSTTAPTNHFGLNDQKLYEMSVSGTHLKPGLNTVEVEVSDLIRSNNYVWGFGVAWRLQDPQEEQLE